MQTIKTIIDVLLLLSIFYWIVYLYEKATLEKYPPGTGQKKTFKSFSPLFGEKDFWSVSLKYYLKDLGIGCRYARILYEGHGNSEEDRFIYEVEFWGKTKKEIAENPVTD